MSRDTVIKAIVDDLAFLRTQIIGFSLFKSTFESTGKHAFCKRQSLRSTQRCSANMRLTFEAIQNRLYLNTSLFSNNIIGGERNFDSKDNIQTVLLFGIIRAP